MLVKEVEADAVEANEAGLGTEPEKAVGGLGKGLDGVLREAVFHDPALAVEVGKGGGGLKGARRGDAGESEDTKCAGAQAEGEARADGFAVRIGSEGNHRWRRAPVRQMGACAERRVSTVMRRCGSCPPRGLRFVPGPERAKRSSFDFASRDEAARGSAQDDNHFLYQSQEVTKEGIVPTGLAIFWGSDFPTLKRGANDLCASGAFHPSRIGDAGGRPYRKPKCRSAQALFDELAFKRRISDAGGPGLKAPAPSAAPDSRSVRQTVKEPREHGGEKFAWLYGMPVKRRAAVFPTGGAKRNRRTAFSCAQISLEKRCDSAELRENPL